MAVMVVVIRVFLILMTVMLMMMSIVDSMIIRSCYLPCCMAFRGITSYHVSWGGIPSLGMVLCDVSSMPLRAENC